MAILYTTKASATGGRAGNAKSEDGVLDVTLTVPKELGGDGATGTNPEQLCRWLFRLLPRCVEERRWQAEGKDSRRHDSDSQRRRRSSR